MHPQPQIILNSLYKLVIFEQIFYFNSLLNDFLYSECICNCPSSSFDSSYTNFATESEKGKHYHPFASYANPPKTTNFLTIANRAKFIPGHLFSVKKCFEPCNEHEVCSKFLKRDPCMFDVHYFKIAHQMYRSSCEQQHLHWRQCTELTRMKNSTGMKTSLDGHACKTVIELGQVS